MMVVMNKTVVSMIALFFFLECIQNSGVGSPKI